MTGGRCGVAQLSGVLAASRQVVNAQNLTSRNTLELSGPPAGSLQVTDVPGLTSRNTLELSGRQHSFLHVACPSGLTSRPGWLVIRGSGAYLR
jgi:hypothetical protein